MHSILVYEDNIVYREGGTATSKMMILTKENTKALYMYHIIPFYVDYIILHFEETVHDYNCKTHRGTFYSYLRGQYYFDVHRLLLLKLLYLQLYKISSNTFYSILLRLLGIAF